MLPAIDSRCLMNGAGEFSAEGAAASTSAGAGASSMPTLCSVMASRSVSWPSVSKTAVCFATDAESRGPSLEHRQEDDDRGDVVAVVALHRLPPRRRLADERPWRPDVARLRLHDRERLLRRHNPHPVGREDEHVVGGERIRNDHRLGGDADFGDAVVAEQRAIARPGPRPKPPRHTRAGARAAEAAETSPPHASIRARSAGSSGF